MGDSDRLVDFKYQNSEAVPQILPEERLRYLGVSLPALIKNDGAAHNDVSSEVRQLQQDLMHTAQSNHLSPSHAAAALNALCRFLEICSTSQNESWSAYCYSVSTCTDLIRLILDRSERFRAKPTRQLLVTLSKLLTRHPDPNEKGLLIHLIVSNCVSSIRKQEDAKSIKSSLTTLEYFMKREDITAVGIVTTGVEGQASFIEATDEPSSEENRVSLRPKIEDFITHVLDWMPYPDCASAISRFLPSFLSSLELSSIARIPKDMSAGIPAGIPFWIEPVRRSLKHDISFLESFENHLLTKLLCRSLWDRKSFLETLPFDALGLGYVGHHSDADIHLCLQAAKVMVLNPKLPDSNPNGKSPISVPDLDALCANLVSHANANVRIAALAMMTSAIKTTAPVPSSVLVCLKLCIPDFHQESDPKIRNGFIASIKRLCIRLSGAVKTCSRPVTKLSTPGDGPARDEKMLTEHIQFVKWYQRYLWRELRPTASYQRHITALKVIPFVFEDTALSQFFFAGGQRPKNGNQYQDVSRDMHTLDFLRPLLDLLADPFDDIRLSASEVISFMYPRIINTDWAHKDIHSESNHVSRDVVELKCVEQVEKSLTRAERNVQRSGRADHADCLGRLNNFYFGLSSDDSYRVIMADRDPFNTVFEKLQKSLQAIEQNLTSNFLAFPLHGHLISLRYIVSRANFARSIKKDVENSSAQKLFSGILACCHKVWNAVKNVLCVDAPEGLPIYHDDEEEFDDVDDKSKDKLSFCWRALKESSLLMRAIVEQGKPTDSAATYELHGNDYKTYGEVIFTQLVELRHRGAFSTVAQTFAAWCIECSKSKQSNVKILPKQWYQQALACVQEQASTLTRRSAGLPALIVGILAAYPSGESFDDIILDLQAIADAPVGGLESIAERRLPQVHALNCLKEVVVDSRYGASTEAHLEVSLGIAVSSLESKIWAIRNCGLMLLQALLRRLNGGTDTASNRVASLHRQSSPLIYEKFPTLPELLQRLVGHPNHNKSSNLQPQRIFPALEIIERFGLPKESKTRDEIWRALMKYLGDPVWSIREKAARTVGTIVRVNELEQQVRDLLNHWNELALNGIHGRLMALRVLFARAMPMILNSSTARPEDPYALLLPVVEKIFTESSCPIIIEAVVDIVYDVAESFKCPEDRIDAGNHIDQIYQLLKVKLQQLLLQNSLLSPRNNGNPSAVSQCLRSLESVMVSGGKRGTNNVANVSGASFIQPQASLSPLYDNFGKVATNPEQFDEHLRLWGGQIAQASLQTASITIYFIPWIRALLLAMNAHSDVSTRLAAVASIELFCLRLFEQTPDASTRTFPVESLAILYDALVDDDEDVRIQAARVVALIISKNISDSEDKTASLSLSPPFARSRLLEHMTSIHSRSATLVLEAVWRLTGLSQSSEVVSRTSMLQDTKLADVVDENISKWNLPSISTMLQEATHSQNVVFEEEKQNLHLDPVIEAESWTQVLIDISLEVWPPSLLLAVYPWTKAGLDCLFSAVEEREDSRLGFTSKADVYALFMQVVLMARFISIKVGKFYAVHQNTYLGIDFASLGWKLIGFYEYGLKNDLHPLILERIERILEEINDISG